MSKGKPTGNWSPNFCRGTGEDQSVPAQHTVESESALSQTVTGQTSDTTIAQTDEAVGQSQPAVEVSTSAADEVPVADSTTETEAPIVTAIAGDEVVVQTEPAFGSIDLNQGISDQLQITGV